MPWLTGKNVQQSNVNQPTAGLDQSLIQWIQGQGFAGLNPATSVDAASAAPYQKMFADQNAQVFGQAKESAGNLTGSGLGAQLGTAGQRASTEQNAFLANLFEQRRQNDSNRFLQLVLGTLGSPAGGVTNTYQPGFLDYAAQGAKAAAPFLTPAAAIAPIAGAATSGAGALAPTPSQSPYFTPQYGNQTQSGYGGSQRGNRTQSGY